MKPFLFKTIILIIPTAGTGFSTCMSLPFNLAGQAGTLSPRHCHPDSGDTAFFLFHHPHLQVFASQFLIFFRKIPLEFQKEAGQRVRLADILGIFVLIQSGNPEKVRKRRLAFENVCIRTCFPVTHRPLVEFIVYLSENLLYHILEGDQSRRTALLVNHDGHVYPAGLEVVQQIVEPAGLGNEESRSYQRLPPEIIPFFKIRKQVLDI